MQMNSTNFAGVHSGGDAKTEPTDADLIAVASSSGLSEFTSTTDRHELGNQLLTFARAVLQRWGQPSGVGKPWGACVSGRVFVGGLPEHARKLAEAENLPIQWLYTAPQPTQAVPPAGREPTEDEIAAWIMKSVRDGKYPITGRTVPFRGELLPMFIAFANDHGIGIKGKEAGNADG